MNDLSPLISAITNLLADPEPSINECASKSLIEIGKNSPLPIIKSITQQLGTFSAESTLNKACAINTIYQIAKNNFQFEMISIVCPILIQLITFNPPPESSVTGPAIELLSYISDRNPTAIASQFNSFSITNSLIEFLSNRARKNDTVFFVTSGKSSSILQKFITLLQPVADEKSRLGTVKLMSLLADLITTEKLDQYIFSNEFSTILKHMMTVWMKTSPLSLQQEYIKSIGTISSYLSPSVLKSDGNIFITSLIDLIKNKELKSYAISSLSAILLTLEPLERKEDRPIFNAQQITAIFFNYIESNYVNIQTDGQVMKVTNESMSGLATLVNLHFRLPIDTLLHKLSTSAPYMYIANYFCSSFAKTEYAIELIDALAAANPSTVELKTLYTTCFCTLLKNCVIKTPSMTKIFQKVSLFCSERSNESRDATFSLLLVVKQFPHCFSFVYPSLFNFIVEAPYFFSTPALIEIASLACDSISKKRFSLDDLPDFDIVYSILLMFYHSELFTKETKRQILHVLQVLSDSTDDDIALSLATPGVVKALQNVCPRYINFGTEKQPCFAPKFKAALRGSLAIVFGHMMMNPDVQKSHDAIEATILQAFEQNDPIEMESVGEYFGLVSRAVCDQTVNFIRAQADLLILNASQKWQFWKKKEKPLIPVPTVVSALSHSLDLAPLTAQLSTLFSLVNSSLYSLVPPKQRADLIAAAFRRHLKDINFSIADPKAFIDASTAILAKASDVETARAALQSLIDGFHSIKNVITNEVLPVAFGATKIDISLIEYAGQLAVAIIDSSHSPAVLDMFHENVIKSLKEDTNAAAACLKAMKTVTEAYSGDLKKANIALIYLVLHSAIKNDTDALKVADLLSTSSENSPSQRILESGEDLHEIFEDVSKFFDWPRQYKNAALEIMVGFTKCCKEEIIDKLVHELYLVSLQNQDVNAAMINLFNINSKVVVEQLLAEENKSKLSEIFTKLMKEKDGICLEILLSLLPENHSIFQLLSDTRLALQFNKFAEKIYFVLSEELLKNPTDEVAGFISEILGVNMENNVDLSGFKAKLLNEPIEAIRSAFKDLSANHIDCSKLMAICKGGDQRVASVAYGEIIANTQDVEMARAAGNALMEIGDVESMSYLCRASSAVKNELAVAFEKCLIEKKAISSLLKVVTSIEESKLFDVRDQLIALAMESIKISSEPEVIRIVNFLVEVDKMITPEQAKELIPILSLNLFIPANHSVAARTLRQAASKACITSLSITENAEEFAMKNASSFPNEMIAKFQELTKHQSPQIRMAAAILLSSLSKKCDAEIVALLNDEDPLVRASAAKAVASLL